MNYGIKKAYDVMKRITSILLILTAAFSLTGCQSGPESEVDTNGAEANQSDEIATDLKITAEGVPVEVRLSSDGQ